MKGMIKMIMVKTLFILMTMVAACAGCVSYPFIDDSIAKLDANSVDVTTRFKLPEVPPRPIEPQTADALVGDWMTGFHNVVYRDIIKDGEIHDYGEKYKGVGEVYGFNANGSCGHNDILQRGDWLVQMKKYGTWSYDSGVLTLHYKKVDFGVQIYTGKAEGPLKENVVKEIDETVTKRVEWFAYNEIAINDNDEIPPPQSGSRESVKVGAYGVKTKREIKVMSMKDDRETGTVSETIYPPMRFKKKEK